MIIYLNQKVHELKKNKIFKCKINTITFSMNKLD